MNSDLPATGTAELLELLAPFVPDDFIDHLWPTAATGGRRRDYTAAQLYRVHLLSLLSPVHSLNLLVKMLPEQRAWRKFAGLRRQTQVPGVRVLHEFRARLGVAGLRRINAHLLQPVIDHYAWRERSVGLIDATDLPAACVGFKKKAPDNTQRLEPLWVDAPSRPGKAAALSATKSTPCVCGCTTTASACCWCPWSVGSPRPMGPKAGCWCPVCTIASGNGIGVRRWSSPTWAVWRPKPSAGAVSAGRWRSWTKLRSDMKLVPPYVAWNQAACPQGEPLAWLGCDGGSQEHWFGTGAAPELCARCWEAARCPRQFAYRAAAHETLLGLLPLASPAAQTSLAASAPLD